MTLADDIASDLAGFDGVQTVSVWSRASNTTDSAVTALRRAISYREAQMGQPLGIMPTDSVFHLQANTVTTAPIQGDKITDSANTAWTVLAVFEETLSTRYKCMVRKQV